MNEVSKSSFLSLDCFSCLILGDNVNSCFVLRSDFPIHYATTNPALGRLSICVIIVFRPVSLIIKTERNTNDENRPA